ncbi:MAG: hypothetical protein V3S14_02240 [Anaerolineae bacterium]
MKDPASSVTYVARWISSLSLLAVIFACLVVWGAIALLFTTPSYAPDSAVYWETQHEDTSQTRRFPAEQLLLWLPIGLGVIICGAGVASLARGQSRNPERLDVP